MNGTNGGPVARLNAPWSTRFRASRRYSVQSTVVCVPAIARKPRRARSAKRKTAPTAFAGTRALRSGAWLIRVTGARGRGRRPSGLVARRSEAPRDARLGRTDEGELERGGPVVGPDVLVVLLV